MKHAYREMPPLREQPFSEEKQDRDGKRVEYVNMLWRQQDWALQHRDRQIEENVRMLAGQQWSIFSDLLNKWIDISEFLTDDERRWRQRPVVNRLLFWFMLTHARLTENPPTVTFRPSTADRFDALLASALDPIFKTLWTELDMFDVLDRMFSWLIPGGHAYIKSRVDTTKGPTRRFEGPATVASPFGGQVQVPNAPFDAEGNPLVGFEGGEMVFTGDAHEIAEGVLDAIVCAPLEVRAQWGPMPHRDKRWLIHRTYLTPEEVWDTWGLDVAPDTFGEDAEGAGELQRLLHGAGYFGAAANQPGTSGLEHGTKSGLVTVSEFWHKPAQVAGMENGRLLVVTQKEVLFDAGRPADFDAAGPIQYFDFVRLPGRPSGTTPQEMLNPLQRTYNRGYAQILEHRNLVANPIGVIDETTDLEPEQVTNRPGLMVKVNRRSGIPALEFVQPPSLSSDVYQTQAMLQDEMGFLGNLEGAEGAPPTRDASGELVKELRFNTDRFIGPTLRRAANVLPHVIRDWMAWLPLIWDEEKVISYAGEDQVTRTVTVFPEMFEKGSVNITVDTESMLPETRSERHQRVMVMYQLGLFGPPGTPEAVKRVYELGRFPHLDRAHRPGGIDRVTAEQENGRMARGEPFESIPVLAWYDHQVHLSVHEEFMKSPEYLDFPPHVQLQFVRHWLVHRDIVTKRFQAMQVAQAKQSVAAEAARAEVQADQQIRVARAAPNNGGSSRNGTGGGGGGGGSPSSNGGRRAAARTS